MSREQSERDASYPGARLAADTTSMLTPAIRAIASSLDAKTYPKSDLSTVYDSRWRIELNLRSIKSVLQMDVLRSKRPSMVRKEIWMHLLAYNIIRKIMAMSASVFRTSPDKLSFKAGLQALNAMRQTLPHLKSLEDRIEIFFVTLCQIDQHKVGCRPGRLEPRETKRRSKPYPPLKEGRLQRRKRLIKFA